MSRERGNPPLPPFCTWPLLSYTFLLNPLTPKPLPTSSPSLQPQLVGEWIGKYHGHFEEVIRIDLQDGKLIATKITGDENVPAGEITWRVDPTTCIGEGQIAGQGFLKPSFVPGHLEILSSSRIIFHWEELGQVEYRRDD